MSESLLGDRVRIHCGDCREVLATLPENSLDACVTDPPYGIGFMGRGWDHGVPGVAFWCHVLRVLKPGAHLLAMGGTRTYHRLACAIEDAGFEIRDTVSWLYGSGFPKSHDVSKGIDRAAGAERPILGQYIAPDGNPRGIDRGIQGGNFAAGRADYVAEKLMTGAATDAAREWQGWGTALKPACELIVLARKPLSEPTVAANVLRWGCGAINVDGCRVGTTKNVPASESKSDGTVGLYGNGIGPGSANDSGFDPNVGRWPANVVHDGSDEVVAAFPESDHARGNTNPTKSGTGLWHDAAGEQPVFGGDFGSAARFFYTSKADADDRLGSKHPTVKPLDLMQWLVRLVTPRGGIVLDPFAGTGTTGEAAWREGMGAVLIEAEPEYQADIRRRMALALAGPDERQRESIKAKNLPRDDGPLFAARETWAQMWAKPFDFSQEPSE